jgi:hypothetical protein
LSGNPKCCRAIARLHRFCIDAERLTRRRKVDPKFFESLPGVFCERAVACHHLLFDHWIHLSLFGFKRMFPGVREKTNPGCPRSRDRATFRGKKGKEAAVFVNQ